jgi:hypothetical protein
MTDPIRLAKESRMATEEMLDAIEARWGRPARDKASLYGSAYLCLAQVSAIAGLMDSRPDVREAFSRHVLDLTDYIVMMAAVMFLEEKDKELLSAATAAAKRPVADMNKAIREVS